MATKIVSTGALRRAITPKSKYSPKERETVYRLLVFLAKLLNIHGVNVIIDPTGNLRRYRDSGVKK